MSRRKWLGFLKRDQDLRVKSEENVGDLGKLVFPEDQGEEAFSAALFEAITDSVESRARRRETLVAGFKVAAAFILFVGLSATFYRLIRKSGHTGPLSENMQHVATRKGEMLMVKLSDGSKVWVNAFSDLSFPETFGTKERKVYLKGEGYFEVVHDATKPFLVQSNHFTVQVLGTHFNVNDYGAGAAPMVTVVSGKVAVTHTHSKESAVFLENDQKAFLDAKSNLMVKKDEANAALLAGWREGNLYFDNISLAQAATLLENRFGTHIELAKSLTARPIFGNYYHPTLPSVIALLVKSMQLKAVQVSGRQGHPAFIRLIRDGRK